MNTDLACVTRTDDEYLVLGRVLMDKGFQDLFRHDAQSACERLDVSLSPEAQERIRLTLARMDSLDPAARGVFTTRLNSLERWRQA